MADRPVRRGGRRKQFTEVISLRLPAALYDAVIQDASRRGLDVAENMRQALTARVVQLKARDLT